MLLETCVALCSAMKSSPQGRGFKSVLAQGPLGLVYEVHGVLSNSSIPSTTEGQPRARAITCNVLGVFYTTLTNINRGLLMLGIRALLDGHWLLEEALLAPTGNFNLNYICVFIY